MHVNFIKENTGKGLYLVTEYLASRVRPPASLLFGRHCPECPAPNTGGTWTRAPVVYANEKNL